MNYDCICYWNQGHGELMFSSPDGVKWYSKYYQEVSIPNKEWMDGAVKVSMLLALMHRYWSFQSDMRVAQIEMESALAEMEGYMRHLAAEEMKARKVT